MLAPLTARMRLACYSSKDLSDKSLKDVASVIFQATCAFRDAKDSGADDSQLGGPAGVEYKMRDRQRRPTENFLEEMASVALVVLSVPGGSPVEKLANLTEPMVKVRPPSSTPSAPAPSALCPRCHHTADMVLFALRPSLAQNFERLMALDALPAEKEEHVIMACFGSSSSVREQVECVIRARLAKTLKKVSLVNAPAEESGDNTISEAAHSQRAPMPP